MMRSQRLIGRASPHVVPARRSDPATSSPEDHSSACVALALLPLIGWRIVRGLRDGRLPLYRTYVTREESDDPRSASCSSCTPFPSC